MKVNFTYKSREQNYTDRTKKKESVLSKIYNGKVLFCIKLLFHHQN